MICLSRDELRELTGYTRPTKVQQWLRANGFVFYIGADGWPRVLKEALVAVPRTLTRSKVDVAALSELQNGKTKKQKERPS